MSQARKEAPTRHSIYWHHACVSARNKVLLFQSLGLWYLLGQPELTNVIGLKNMTLLYVNISHFKMLVVRFLLEHSHHH